MLLSGSSYGTMSYTDITFTYQSLRRRFRFLKDLFGLVVHYEKRRSISVSSLIVLGSLPFSIRISMQ